MRVSPSRFVSPLVCLIAFSALPLFAAAPELPQDPRAWINSRPLSLDSLKGKGIVLYFFEESCPKCVESWPPMLEASQEFQGQPVVFIAVNSGNSSREVASYARKTNISWPIIVDSDRSLEKAFDLPKEISLKNIKQIKIIKPDGEVEYGNPSDLKGTADRALAGAEWKLDPMEVPDSIKPLWMEVELGDYQRALPLLKRSVKSSDDDVRTAAEKLQTLVLADLEELQTTASRFDEQNDDWNAFKTYTKIVARFKGYDEADEAVDREKELSRTDAVKEQESAYKKLALAKRTGAKGDERSIARAIGQLEKLIEDFPDSDAAAEARDILDQIEAAKAAAANPAADGFPAREGNANPDIEN